MLVLLTVLDGVVDEWGVCWGVGVDVDVEQFDGVGDIAGHRE